MQDKTTTMPHDAVFKQFLTHPETARDFLEIHLPEHLLEVCDLNSLQLASGSFIEEKLRVYYSDVLYSLKTQTGDGYVYALIEHQSSPDRHMAFRLMRYAIAAMQRHLDLGNESLPLVIPILFYHGRTSPYPWSMKWLENFDAPKLAWRLYGGEFPLVDVTAIPDDEIMKHRRVAMLELLQKHIRQRDLASLQEKLIALLLSGFTTGRQLEAAIHYIFRSGNISEPVIFFRNLTAGIPEHKEALMTIAEWLEQKGWAKGKQEGAQTIASRLLKMGLPTETILEATGLSEEELKQLQQP